MTTDKDKPFEPASWEKVNKHINDIVADIVKRDPDRLKFKRPYPRIKQYRRYIPSARNEETEQLDEVSARTLAKAVQSSSDNDPYQKDHDPQKYIEYAKKHKSAKVAADVANAAKKRIKAKGFDELAFRQRHIVIHTTDAGKANKLDINALKNTMKAHILVNRQKKHPRNEGINMTDKQDSVNEVNLSGELRRYPDRPDPVCIHCGKRRGDHPMRKLPNKMKFKWVGHAYEAPPGSDEPIDPYYKKRWLAKKAKQHEGAEMHKQEQLDEISAKTLAHAVQSASDDYSGHEKEHDPQKYIDHAKKFKSAKVAADVANAAKEKIKDTGWDELAHRARHRITRATATGKANKQDIRALKNEEYEREQLDEATRKHFRMVADTVKQIPDEAKRQEQANIHAEVFKKMNPRFDPHRFHAACGTKCNEEVEDVFEALRADGKDEMCTIHSPGHRLHGKQARIFHKFDDGRINVQIRRRVPQKPDDVTNLTLKPGQFKMANEQVSYTKSIDQTILEAMSKSAIIADKLEALKKKREDDWFGGSDKDEPKGNVRKVVGPYGKAYDPSDEDKEMVDKHAAAQPKRGRGRPRKNPL
jgi:hypothetical protein